LNELFLTSWDLNNRSPRFFSKWSYDNVGQVEGRSEDKYDHHINLLNMTLATSATPFYFSPAMINGHFYISGDNIAMSPAMYAYFYANERLQL